MMSCDIIHDVMSYARAHSDESIPSLETVLSEGSRELHERMGRLVAREMEAESSQASCLSEPHLHTSTPSHPHTSTPPHPHTSTLSHDTQSSLEPPK